MINTVLCWKGAQVRARRAIILTLFGALLSVALSGSCNPGFAETFLPDGPINFIVGMPPGGSVDAYARLLQKWLPRFMPENPTTVVQNKPGAGSLLSVMAIANSRPSDGLMIGSFSASLIPDAIADPQRFRVDFRDFRFIGKIGEDYRVCYVRSALGIRNLKELAERGGVTFAATAPGTSGNVNLVILRDLFRIPLKVVLGYEGSAAKRLAFERGEVDGDCGGVESIPSDWLVSGRINLLVRFLHDLQGPVGEPIPFGGDLADTADKQLYDFLTAPERLSGMLLVSNHVPQKIIEQLRQAFDAMAADQNFQKHERALGLPVEVVSGVKLDEEIERLYATPSAVLEKAKMLLRE